MCKRMKRSYQPSIKRTARRRRGRKNADARAMKTQAHKLTSLPYTSLLSLYPHACHRPIISLLSSNTKAFLHPSSPSSPSLQNYRDLSHHPLLYKPSPLPLPSSSYTLHTRKISTATKTFNNQISRRHPRSLLSSPSPRSPHPLLSSPYTIHTRKINTDANKEIILQVATDPLVNSVGDPVLLITGPVSFFEVGLSAIHSATGLPWWALIVGFTLLLRTALTPLAYKQRINMVHTINVYPDMMWMTKERRIARAKGDAKTADKLYQEMLALTNKYKVSPVKNFMVLAVQIPVLVCFFFALSDMAATFPSFASGGFFETSLSAKPTWWAPIISFLPGIIANEMSSPVAKLQVILKWAIRGLYMVVIPFSYLLPSAIMYYWIPSNLFSAAQSYVLTNQEISKKIGIPDVNQSQRIKK